MRAHKINTPIRLGFRDVSKARVASAKDTPQKLNLLQFGTTGADSGLGNIHALMRDGSESGLGLQAASSVGAAKMSKIIINERRSNISLAALTLDTICE